MDARIKTVISLVREGGDWKQEITKEFRLLHPLKQRYYIQGILKEIILEKLPVVVFKECLTFVKRLLIPYGDDEWYELVVECGSEEYFAYMLEEMGGEIAEQSSVIFNGVGDKDRLVQLLEWINNKALVGEMFENYIEEINSYMFELDSGQKAVIGTLIDFLKINAQTYDWGAKESVVNQWILSVLDQV